MLQCMGLQRIGHNLVTEQQQEPELLATDTGWFSSGQFSSVAQSCPTLCVSNSSDTGWYTEVIHLDGEGDYPTNTSHL